MKHSLQILKAILSICIMWKFMAFFNYQAKISSTNELRLVNIIMKAILSFL